MHQRKCNFTGNEINYLKGRVIKVNFKTQSTIMILISISMCREETLLEIDRHYRLKFRTNKLLSCFFYYLHFQRISAMFDCQCIDIIHYNSVVLSDTIVFGGPCGSPNNSEILSWKAVAMSAHAQMAMLCFSNPKSCVSFSALS